MINEWHLNEWISSIRHSLYTNNSNNNTKTSKITSSREAELFEEISKLKEELEEEKIHNLELQRELIQLQDTKDISLDNFPTLEPIPSFCENSQVLQLLGLDIENEDPLNPISPPSTVNTKDEERIGTKEFEELLEDLTISREKRSDSVESLTTLLNKLDTEEKDTNQRFTKGFVKEKKIMIGQHKGEDLKDNSTTELSPSPKKNTISSNLSFDKWLTQLTSEETKKKKSSSVSTHKSGYKFTDSPKPKLSFSKIQNADPSSVRLGILYDGVRLDINLDLETTIQDCVQLILNSHPSVAKHLKTALDIQFGLFDLNQYCWLNSQSKLSKYNFKDGVNLNKRFYSRKRTKFF